MLGIIFCSNIKHIMVYSKNNIHPEQPGRVLTAERDLTKKYKDMIVKDKDYSIDEIIKHIKDGDFTKEHLRIIEHGFYDINSAYSIKNISLEACINETRSLMTICDLMIDNKIDYGINVVRPPGHHCCNKKPGGFCIINTAIISAKRLLKKFNRVVIFDIDLHHGGGTQKMVERNPDLMYVSIHNKNVWSDGLYKRGISGKRNRIINVALPGQSNDEKYIQISKDLIPEMKLFSDIIILSVGFDTHKDEISVGESKAQRMNITKKYYGELGKMLRNNFKKVFVVLEGGYNEKVISEGLSEIIDNLLKK